MQVHFEDSTYFFKLFGVQNSTKLDIADILDKINKKYNKLFLLLSSDNDFENDVKFGFVRIKTIQLEIHPEKSDFIIDDKKYIALLDHFKGKNGLYTGYFIFSKLKNKDIPIKNKLSEIVSNILLHDKFELRLKKIQNKYLWKLLVENKEDKIKIHHHFQFTKIFIIPNVPLHLAESNSSIYSLLKQYNTKSSKSTTPTNESTDDITPDTSTNSSITTLDQKISQFVATYTKELTNIQHQQKILIDSILLITQSSQSNYILQKEIFNQFTHIKDSINSLEQSFTNNTQHNSSSASQPQENNTNEKTSPTSTPSTTKTSSTTNTPPVPSNKSTTPTHSNSNKPFFNPKNMFNT